MSGVFPELRFPKFVENWELRTLGDIAQFSKGRGISKADITHDGMTPCIRYGELYTTYGTVIEDVVSFTNVDASKLRLSKGGEIIIPASGETSKDIATAAVVVQAGIALGSDLNILTTNQNGHFIAEYVSGRKSIALAGLAQGNSVVHLYPAQISSLDLGIPSLPEQQKIADFLGAVDAKIIALRRKKSGLEDFKFGLMQRLFSRELRFSRDDGTAFPDWEEKALGDLGTFSKGKGISKADINAVGDLPCIRYGEIYTHYSERITHVLSRTSASPSDQVLSEINDVIIPASGETPIDMARACCVLVSGVALGSDINIFRGSLNGEFLAYFLTNARRTEIAQIAQGNSVVHLYPAQLRKIIVAVPHPDEQCKVANAISAMDSKIAAVADQIVHMETFKKALLQQMFV